MTRRGRGKNHRAQNLNLSVASTIVSNFASPAAAVITAPLLARELGIYGRGAYAAVIAPSSLAMLLFAAGFPTTVTYFVARRELSVARARRVATVMGLTMGVVGFAVVWLVAPVVLHHERGLVGTMRLAGLLLIPAGLAAMTRGLHQGLRRFGRLNAERWLGVMSRLSLIVCFAGFGVLTIRSAAWITLGTVVAASLILAPGLRSEPKDRELAGSGPDVATLAKYTALVALGSISGGVIIRLDQAVMPILASVKQLSYYAVAVSVAEVPIVLSLAVRDVVLTVSTERASPQLVGEAARTVLAVQLAGAACLAPVMPFLVPLAFGRQFAPAVWPTEVLLLAGALGAPGSVLNQGLLGQNSPGLRSLALGGAAAVTIVSLVFLVPVLGAVGAALASLVAYLFSSVANAWLLARLARQPMRTFLVPGRRDLAALVRRARIVAGRLR